MQQGGQGGGGDAAAVAAGAGGCGGAGGGTGGGGGEHAAEERAAEEMQRQQTIDELVRARASLTEAELAALGATDEERTRRLREMPFAQLAAQIMCCSRSEIHALPKVLALLYPYP